MGAGTILAAVAAAGVAAAAAPAAAGGPPPATFARDGVEVELSVKRAGGDPSPAPLVHGELVDVRFRLRDATSGLPLRGTTPGAWLDLLPAGQAKEADDRTCRERAGTYLKGIVGMQPLVDLNGYHLLVLNSDASISVVDPVVGISGRTSLYASILLEKPGADWVKSVDEKRLYVSMPRAGKVAVVDLDSFQVLASVPAGKDPTRLALSADGATLWVANDAAGAAASGVTVLDTARRERLFHVPTGAGHHELALTSDGRRAFVTNRKDGTVAVVDAGARKVVARLRTGPLPISVAASRLSGAVYVADGKDGGISVVDPERLAITARVQARPGLGPLRFDPEGRWGVAVNPAEQAAYVVDAARNRIAHTVPLPGQPFQVAFTRAFAYLRLLDTENMALVSLAALGAAEPPAVKTIPVGAKAPRIAAGLSIADGVVPAAADAAVFVASPADNATYFYMEGMNAPAGSFGGYGHAVRAVMLADRSLREVEPGVYGGAVRLPRPGRYQVAFLLDAPRLLHCFSLEVGRNPVLKERRDPIAVEYVGLPPVARVGEARLRFRLADPETGAPKAGLSDVRLLTFAATGAGRSERAARDAGGGLYEADVRLETTGAHYVHLSVPSLDVGFGDLPYRSLVVVPSGEEPPHASR